jgi:hypothetical protein
MPSRKNHRRVRPKKKGVAASTTEHAAHSGNEEGAAVESALEVRRVSAQEAVATEENNNPLAEDDPEDVLQTHADEEAKTEGAPDATGQYVREDVGSDAYAEAEAQVSAHIVIDINIDFDIEIGTGDDGKVA